MLAEIKTRLRAPLAMEFHTSEFSMNRWVL